ncbi:unnamed protein product [Dovyalis caffra]|uniref:F-box domain-containing protein n=1 Tax=Dovyalis caffra TaxID=77055 RepID=A0AAV1RCJ1_9ROSI|nr:unnamed protein product [Dovyalis caffra]
MKQSDRNIQRTLPFDISLKIASSLQVLDLCSLGSCSQFWRDLCGSDSIWESLTKQRWPLPLHSSSLEPNTKGWKEIYIRMHREKAGRAAEVVGFVEQCSLSESIDVAEYQQAIEDLSSMQLSFEDVQMFLFKPKFNVLLNLVGLHYCIFCLEMPAGQVMDTLVGCNILERKVCVRWWKLGRWFYGFRMRDESHSRWVSLEDLLTGKGEEVLGVLRRGAVYEVFRVEISMSNPTSTSWYCQSTQGQD